MLYTASQIVARKDGAKKSGAEAPHFGVRQLAAAFNMVLVFTHAHIFMTLRIAAVQWLPADESENTVQPFLHTAPRAVNAARRRSLQWPYG
jgi:hypothetical protein